MPGGGGSRLARCRFGFHALEGAIIEPRDLAYLLLRAATDKKAQEPVVLDVNGLASYADYFVICSAGSSRQVQAITEWVETTARKRGIRALSVEGQAAGKWVLMDYGTVLLHIFYEPVRLFYDLEGLWADAPKLPIDAEPFSLSGQERAAGTL